MIEKLNSNLFNKSILQEMEDATENTCARTEKGYVNALTKLYIDGAFQVFLKDTDA